jgi:hypothetical protein
VGAVRHACTRQGRRSERLRLDLADVTYVDAAGIQTLRDFMREGIKIAVCSSFVGELFTSRAFESAYEGASQTNHFVAGRTAREV